MSNIREFRENFHPGDLIPSAAALLLLAATTCDDVTTKAYEPVQEDTRPEVLEINGIQTQFESMLLQRPQANGEPIAGETDSVLCKQVRWPMINDEGSVMRIFDISDCNGVQPTLGSTGY